MNPILTNLIPINRARPNDLFLTRQKTLSIEFCKYFDMVFITSSKNRVIEK